MAPTPFSIERIDHIKVSVPDRHEAAKWYQDVFGLRILHGPAWDAAAAIPDGPLFLGVDDAVDGTKVVLFQGEPLGKHPPIGLTRAAFSVPRSRSCASSTAWTSLSSSTKTGSA